jgi:hypothetical protein
MFRSLLFAALLLPALLLPALLFQALLFQALADMRGSCHGVAQTIAHPSPDRRQ